MSGSFDSSDAAWAERDERAKSMLEIALGIDLVGVQLGEDWVLEPTSQMLERCQRLLSTHPPMYVIESLIAGLRESYQLKGVHQVIVDAARQIAERWRSGERDVLARRAIFQVAHAFKYGVRSTDLQLLLDLASDPAFTLEGDPEDLRNYWFDSLRKIKDPLVTDLSRRIIDSDLNVWKDYRLLSAASTLPRPVSAEDVERLTQVANEHPDAEIRRAASRTIRR